MLSSTSRPSCWIARPRTGAGTAAHSRWPRARPRRRRRRWAASPSRTSATVCDVSAGLVEVSWPPGASVAGRPAMIELTVRDMALNLARIASDPSRGAGSRQAAQRPTDHRCDASSLLPLLARRLVLAPAAAQAATPGVNIVGSADVAAAAAHGRQDRARVRRAQQLPGGLPRIQGHRHDRQGQRHGCRLRPRRHPRRGRDSTRPTSRTSPPALRRPDEDVRAAPPPTRSGTRRTRPTSGARRSTPAHYAAILKAAYPRIKAADPSAKVLLGPLTGNNYNFLGQIYAAGAGSSFDAAAVHTDTACLVEPPSSFYREGGNVARFTFLGFRTVHDVMVANGDGAKPIWMTELGWTTTTTTCARGMWAGQKPSGVTRGRAGGQPRGGLPLPRGLSLHRGRDVVHAQGLERQRRRARPLRAAAPRQHAQALMGRVPVGGHARRPAHRAVRRLRRRRPLPSARRPRASSTCRC